MKKLYQTLKTLFGTRPRVNPELELLSSPEIVEKNASVMAKPGAEKYSCYMDAYQHQQMKLLKKIGINFTQITTNNENL